MRWLRRRHGVRTLEPIAIDAVSKPTDLFRCEWYRAILSAACCLARQVSAKRSENRSRKEKLHGVGLASIVRCIDCPFGDRIAEQVKVRKPKSEPPGKRKRRKKKRHARSRG